jgi:hypothetical protein
MTDLRERLALITTPVTANKYSRDGAIPRRGSIIFFPGEKNTTVYRVVKMADLNYSAPRVFTVPVDLEPIEGKDGTAYSHYERSGYSQDILGSLARSGALIVERGYPINEEFIAEATARQLKAYEDWVAAQEAYRVDPAGGVADRIARIVSDLEWRGKSIRGDRRLIDNEASSLEAELDYLTDDQVAELKDTIGNLYAISARLEVEENILDNERCRIQELVDGLRAVEEVQD